MVLFNFSLFDLIYLLLISSLISVICFSKTIKKRNILIYIIYSKGLFVFNTTSIDFNNRFEILKRFYIIIVLLEL